MHKLATSATDQRFEAPQLHFADLNANVLAAVVAAAANGKLAPSEGFNAHLQAVESILAELESRI